MKSNKSIKNIDYKTIDKYDSSPLSLNNDSS